MSFGEAAGQGFNNPVQSLLLLVIQKAGQGIFIYSPTVGAGNLVGSWTNNSGVDKYGNPYSAGLEIGDSSNPQILLAPGAGSALFEFVFNNAAFSNAFMEAFGTTGELVAQSGSNLTTGLRDTVSTTWAANSTGSAEFILQYNSDIGANVDYLFADCTGIAVQAARISAVVPGTGTSPVNPPIIEFWHNLSLSGWSAASGYHARYRIGAEGDLQLSGRINSGGTSLTVGTVPSGYFQLTSPQMSVPLDAIAMASSATTASPRIAVSNGGLITIAGCTVNTSSVISLDGISFPISAG